MHNQTYPNSVCISSPKINEKVRINSYRYNKQRTQLLEGPQLDTPGLCNYNYNDNYHYQRSCSQIS